MQWVIDPAHSQIQFSVKHLGISTVRGTFGTFSGTIDEEGGSAKSVTVDIDVASLNTGNEQRDGHLRSADFFDVENHPKASFTLTSFERSGDDVTATGDLTIRGITKAVTLKGDGRTGYRPVGQPEGVSHARDQDPAQGLGPRVERGARSGRRARVRRGEAGY